MEGRELNTPVLFIIFNRPATTRAVFEAIRRVRPTRLYIAADGPRPQVESDVELCAQARKVRDLVDWESRITTLFREENLGSDIGVSTAINWFFENEPEGIILEDDCIPTGKFFWLCQELLKHYRDDNRVMQICGSGFPDRLTERYSYYFSRHAPVGGWASWRRAWKLNGFDKTRYKSIREHGFFDEYFPSRKEKLSWFRIFDAIASDANTQKLWKYRWDFSRFIQSGLSVIPTRNLITPVSLDVKDGGDTPGPSVLTDLLDHPPFVMRNMDADRQYYSDVIEGQHVEKPKGSQVFASIDNNKDRQRNE